MPDTHLVAGRRSGPSERPPAPRLTGRAGGRGRGRAALGALGRSVTIDATAAGWGWSVAIPGAFGPRMDLLTAVMHEIGHVLGFAHSDAGPAGLSFMAERLSPTTRLGTVAASEPVSPTGRVHVQHRFQSSHRLSYAASAAIPVTLRPSPPLRAPLTAVDIRIRSDCVAPDGSRLADVPRPAAR